jgi:hypothetical protein
MITSKMTCFHTTFVVLIYAIMDFHMCLKVLHHDVLSTSNPKP